MPLTDSGLWVPRHLPSKKRFWAGFNLPVIVSCLSLLIAAASLWLTRSNNQAAQRAYVFHEVQLLNPDDLKTSVRNNADPVRVSYRFIVKNLGNTPASDIRYDIK